MVFSNETRKQTIHQLKHTELDLLIVGGGITGAGVAIQAAASGIKTGLIEMQDFAEGTSSRSTKLVHGGIRYLKSFDVGVVADTVKERAVVQGIAPHIPRPFPMLLPIYQESGSTFDMFSVKIAMDLYDRLAGVEGSQYANYTVTKDEVLQREPQLSADNLQGGGVYLDFVNNDARLVIENIKEADELGGLMASHVKAVGVLHNDAGQVVGLHVKDLLDDTEFDIHAKLVINTTGPWADKFNALDDHEKHAPTLRPTKGVHLVVDGSRLPVPQPTYMDTGLNDGRMFFVVPREGKTYFGTTDTDYTGDYEHPRVEQEDVDYLLKVVNKRFPESHMTIDDVPSVFDRKYTYHCYRIPDKRLMQQAAEKLTGRHDFRNFSSAKKTKSTVREIFDIDIYGDIEEMQILIHADDFLHNMARIIVGTLMDIGLGNRSVQDIDDIFAGILEASAPCDPKGLYLQEITY